jgi:hypothetical protein
VRLSAYTVFIRDVRNIVKSSSRKICPRCRWKCNNKICIMEAMYEGVD